MSRWNAYGWSCWWLPGSVGVVLNGWVLRLYIPNGKKWPAFKREPNIWRTLGEPIPKKEPPKKDRYGRHQ